MSLYLSQKHLLKVSHTTLRFLILEIRSKNGFGQSVPARQSGKFTKDESETVKKAIADYCEMKRIPVSRLTSECDHQSSLKGAWMEIAKRLPHRSVQSVYRHGIRQLHPFNRGQWNESETQQLMELVEVLGKKWSVIQNKLNRSADSCRDKYRECSKDFVRGRWSQAETDKLCKYIRQTTGITESMAKDMKALEKVAAKKKIQISWSEVSKRMEDRSRLACFKKWEKLTGTYQPSKAKPSAAPSTEEKAAASKKESDNDYDAKLAEETVEAVGLPDTQNLIRVDL